MNSVAQKTSVSERLRKGELSIEEFAQVIEECRRSHPGAKIHIGRNILLMQTKDGLKSLSELLHRER